MKANDKILIICILLFIIVLCIGIFSFVILFATYTDEKDFCMDTGICKDGMNVNTKYGKIIIDKENCIKHKWIWNEEKSFCKIK